MINILKTIILLLAFFSSSAMAQTPAERLKVIPAPNNIKYMAGEFIFSQKTSIYIKNKQNNVLDFFTSYLKNQRNYTNRIIQSVPKNLTGLKDAVIIQVSDEGELPSE